MVSCIVPRQQLPLYGMPLCRIRLRDLIFPSDMEIPADGNLGDLAKDDHVILPSCTRAYFSNHSGIRGQVSVWVSEPPAIQTRFYRWMHVLARHFDHVLTYDQQLLASLPNAVFVAHGGCWVKDYASAGETEKTRHMSIVASPKRNAPGHRLRHSIIRWARERDVELTAFGKSYVPLENKREGHAPFRFSVVIENSRSSHYFTEKLIDSFVCLSLPIYWGTPDVGQYFDTGGMIVCESAEEIKKAISGVDRQAYEDKKPALARNRSAALNYVDPKRLVFAALLNHPQMNHTPTAIA